MCSCQEKMFFFCPYEKIRPPSNRTWKRSYYLSDSFTSSGQKKLLISRNACDDKNFHLDGCKFFFLIDFLEILFFLLRFLLLFLLFLLFVCLFICLMFFKLKMNILIHIPLCIRVSDKKIFTRQIFRNKTTFFGLILTF